jgi:hypothetical protein
MRTLIDITTCMYHTGIATFTDEEVYIAKALLKAGRADLIGIGCDALIPANPPKVALRARMEKANKSLTEGKYVHTIPNQGQAPAPTPARAGYRPARKTARRRPK